MRWRRRASRHGRGLRHEKDRREAVFLCVFAPAGASLRRPHFFQQRKKWGKERRQKLRFCTSSARYTWQQSPAYSRGHSLSSSLSDKRTVPAFTGAEASAAACFSHGRGVFLYRVRGVSPLRQRAGVAPAGASYLAVHNFRQPNQRFGASVVFSCRKKVAKERHLRKGGFRISPFP